MLAVEKKCIHINVNGKKSAVQRARGSMEWGDVSKKKQSRTVAEHIWGKKSSFFVNITITKIVTGWDYGQCSLSKI